MSATTTWTSIDIITISDIHLGNAANPAEFVIQGLEKKLSMKYMNGANILFIVGDVFDRGLPLNHRDVPHIASWIRRVLARCARLGIVVVVLEGTPSHDRLQSQLFMAINDAAEDSDKCDLRYIKEVQIEYIEKYDIRLLCIPDEKNTSDEVTLRQVRAMMQAQALEKVDFAIMHGFFDFQIPFGRHSRFHDSQVYLDLVRYLIFIGHDHTFQKRDRIIVQGSPDRQRHGMEEDKGFVRARVNRDGSYKATFEVNEHAMVFKTVEVADDLELAIAQVYAVCDRHHQRAHVRIAARKGHPILNALDTFRQQYPLVQFTEKKLDDQVEEPILDSLVEESEYVPFTIDSSNIRTIVQERLNTPLLDERELKYFHELMDSCM